MSNSSSNCGNARMRKTLCVLAACLLLCQLTPSFAFGQDDDADRKKAFQLYEDGEYLAALPLFQKLEKAHPNDAAILERLAFIVIMQNDTLKDAAERKAGRKRGRELLVRAKNAGSQSTIVASLIESLPEDGGSDSGFSKRKEVEDAMRAGEAAFARNEFPKAIEYYQEALLLEPTLYEAALYIGDSYFAAAEQRKAGEWFAKAIEIDPNRETAYRYWADALMKQARVTEAGDKFIEAYIAEPYNRLSNSALVAWANKVGIELNHPNIEFSSSVTAKQNGDTSIALDSDTLLKGDKGSSTAWMMYGIKRAGWQKEFVKQYPEESVYRHSLKEETDAIRAALKQVDVEKNGKTIDPSLVTLAKLDKEGLLEPYILLAKVDAGIAKDFKAYRKDHVDKLREYVTKYLLTNGGKN